MKRLDAIYKCRLCGKEYVECSTSGEKSNQRFVMDMMYRAVRQKKPEEVMEPTLYECHFCGDGYVQHHEQCPRTYDEGLGRSDRRPWPQARPLPGV